MAPLILYFLFSFSALREDSNHEAVQISGEVRTSREDSHQDRVRLSALSLLVQTRVDTWQEVELRGRGSVSSYAHEGREGKVTQ